MSTHVTAIITFANTDEAILDYLVKRTADTVGAKIERSDAVAVGRVLDSDVARFAVPPGSGEELNEWLEENTGEDGHIRVQLTRVEVEVQLAGSPIGNQILLAYPYARQMATGDPGGFPVFDPQDRGLLFLIRIPMTEPYAPFIPQPAYRLAPGEIGIHTFHEKDFSENGQVYTRDRTVEIEALIEAVRWYTSLPQPADALKSALIQALDHPNPLIARHGIRALAHRGETGAVQAFRERLTDSDDERRTRLMLGLWLLGSKEVARDELDDLFNRHGKFDWLADWDVQPTEGRHPATLYGPDPAFIKGD